MKLSLPFQFLIVLVVSFLIAWYPLSIFTDENFIRSVEIAALVMTFNAMLGYVAIEKSFFGSNSQFMVMVLGGMFVRLILLGFILFVLIKVFHANILALLSTMFFYYIVYTILEIIYITQKITTTKKS
ncbi:MAG: hypothetical protein AAB071_06525 [Bacteroidota bacterium]